LATARDQGERSVAYFAWRSTQQINNWSVRSDVSTAKSASISVHIIYTFFK